MASCPSCGKELPGEFPFCPFCGAPLAAAPEAREQPKVVTVLFCDLTWPGASGSGWALKQY